MAIVTLLLRAAVFYNWRSLNALFWFEQHLTSLILPWLPQEFHHIPRKEAAPGCDLIVYGILYSSWQHEAGPRVSWILILYAKAMQVTYVAIWHHSKSFKNPIQSIDDCYFLIWGRLSLPLTPVSRSLLLFLLSFSFFSYPNWGTYVIMYGNIALSYSTVVLWTSGKLVAAPIVQLIVNKLMLIFQLFFRISESSFTVTSPGNECSLPWLSP